MNCVEFRQQLENAIDERQSLDNQELTAHVAACPECQVLWEDQAALNAAIHVWKSKVAHIDFTDRVLAALRSSNESSDLQQVTSSRAAPSVEQVPRSARSAFGPLVVTVALVLIAVTLVMREKPADNTIVKSVPVQPMNSHEGVADLSDLISDAKSAWLGLAQSTVQRTQDLKVFVPNLPSSNDEPQPALKETDAPKEDTDLAPVPGELRRAFEFLFKAAGAEDATT